MATITWDDFTKVDMRIGTIVNVEPFPEARKPAWKITVDFGPEIGRLRTSAQVVDLYAQEDLLGRQVIGVINLPEKQIGPIRSQFLLTGFAQQDGYVVLATGERPIPDGQRLH